MLCIAGLWILTYHWQKRTQDTEKQLKTIVPVPLQLGTMTTLLERDSTVMRAKVVVSTSIVALEQITGNDYA